MMVELSGLSDKQELNLSLGKINLVPFIMIALAVIFFPQLLLLTVFLSFHSPLVAPLLKELPCI